jgi:hypothetical protein
MEAIQNRNTLWKDGVPLALAQLYRWEGEDFGQNIWIKVRCYWKHPWGSDWELREQSGNLMGTHRELKGKMLGTKEKWKKILHFLAWTNSPIINWGYLWSIIYLFIVGIRSYFTSSIVMSIKRGQGKAEICPGGSHYHPDRTASHPPLSSICPGGSHYHPDITASHPPLSSTVFFSLS